MLAELAQVQTRRGGKPARRLLLTSLQIRTGIETPAHESIVAEEVRSISREDCIDRAFDHRAKDEAAMRSRWSRSCHTRVQEPADDLAHPRGKAAIAGGSGQPNDLALALLLAARPSSRSIPLFVGESLDPKTRGASARTLPISRRTTLHGPPIRCRTWRRSSPGPRARADVDLVNLVAQDDAGYQALVARPMLEGLSRTVIELSKMSQIAKAG